MHHRRLLKHVLRHKNQNMQAVGGRARSYFARLHAGKIIKKEPVRRVTCIRFDGVSRMHQYSRTCIVASYKAAGLRGPRVVYTSLPRVMSRFYSKRTVLKKVKAKLYKC